MNIIAKLEKDGKNNFYSHCVECAFKKFETIVK